MDAKLPINFASKEQLMTIKGIGEALADTIIDFRESKGKLTPASCPA